MSVRSVAGVSLAKTGMSVVIVLTQLTQVDELVSKKAPNKRERV